MVAAAAVFAAYYWILVMHPFAASPGGADAQLEADIASSRALFEQRQFNEALAPTERLAKQLGTQAIYHERLAQIYHELNRFDDEAAAWEHMMATSPTPVDACPMIADAQEKAGHVDATLAALEKCASLPPINPDFLLRLGQTLLKLERKAEARRAFERGLEVDPTYADLHLLLGVRQFDEGDHAAARRSFEEFLRLAPARKAEVDVWLERTANAK
jgi:tetratricopeptide (TPR) repeat protein